MQLWCSFSLRLPTSFHNSCPKDQVSLSMPPVYPLLKYVGSAYPFMQKVFFSFTETQAGRGAQIPLIIALHSVIAQSSDTAQRINLCYLYMLFIYILIYLNMGWNLNLHVCASFPEAMHTQPTRLNKKVVNFYLRLRTSIGKNQIEVIKFLFSWTFAQFFYSGMWDSLLQGDFSPVIIKLLSAIASLSQFPSQLN